MGVEFVRSELEPPAALSMLQATLPATSIKHPNLRVNSFCIVGNVGSRIDKEEESVEMQVREYRKNTKKKLFLS